MIRVKVQSLQGKSMTDATIDDQSTVATLKQSISDTLQVPQMCMDLVTGSVVLQDAERLSQYCDMVQVPNQDSDEEDWSSYSFRTLSVTLMLSFHRVLHALVSDSDVNQRVAALQALAGLGSQRGEGAVEVVQSCLKDAEWRVRSEAVQVLPKLAQKGNSFAIAVIVERLQDLDFDVRRAATAALLAAAGKGNASVISAVSALLEHRDPGVRRTAMRALPQVVEKGDPRGVAAVSKYLWHENDDVKLIAHRTLLSLSGTE
mmetsp:Transcript_20901/g.56084  ORF Transcript_20901/g.56084 Transcript_20901/m.56084 type:complete len:260 (-) Transcript_20901:34-813(-)